MGDSAARMQVTSDSSHSSALLSKEMEESTGDGKSVNGFLNAITSSSRANGSQIGQNGYADARVELCPKDHICHKCCFGYYGNSAIMYGAQDAYIPASSLRTKTQRTYNTEAAMDEAGNIWQGSYNY